jgi:DNA topoisomerase VI subunit B
VSAASAQHVLQRETFQTSRLLDFCSQRELVKQVGHAPDQWPLVVLKELVDNAIDAAEEADTAPVIRVDVTEKEIIVADNGPGIPVETVVGILDFSVRVSSREAYVSPTRGAQGNALKTIVAMAFALDGAEGETLIESRGVAHRISFKIDQLRSEPRITHTHGKSLVRKGTKITVYWPVSSCSILTNAESRFLQVAADFGWFNPHLKLTVTWNDKCRVDYKASDKAWAKWRPQNPTSPHWYDAARLRRLMAAYISRDEDQGREPRTVREFIAEFRGLSSTIKQKLVLEQLGAARLSLPEFFGDGESGNIADLLAAMGQQSNAVKPKDLGVIGKDHLAARFEAIGADLDTFQYRRLFGETDGIPYVVEAAFAYCPEVDDEARSIMGLNWSPTLGNPFREIGGDESLDDILSEQRASYDQPIVFALHLINPRIEYTDHGKTAVAVSDDLATQIKSATVAVTKAWAKQIKAEERDYSAQARRHDALRRQRICSVKDAAEEVMEQAYMKASSNGALPALARQLMYQARPRIQSRTGKPLNDQYFCQNVLPNYLMEFCPDWDIAYDDRGHFTEPHTGRTIGIGTVGVRDYLSDVAVSKLIVPGFAAGRVATSGPAGCFGAVLFIEKEGWWSLLEKVHLAERYDLALMSTKGLSVTAARKLVETLCRRRVPLLVLHDFDKSGFSILGTLQRNTRRYTFDRKPNIIDLGLRLEDVRELGLEPEDVFDKANPETRRANLLLNGATSEEAEFLLTKRVELNALTSGQLVAFIERKLAEHGIRKVMPKVELLRDTYRLMINNGRIEPVVKKVITEIGNKPIAVPANLTARVAAHLRQHPNLRWDAAVAAIAEEDGEADK